LDTIRERRETMERRKREVEDAIMRGVSASAESPSPATEGEFPAQHVNGRAPTSSVEPERPKVEELTPPPTGFVTPTHSPRFEGKGLRAHAANHHVERGTNDQTIHHNSITEPSQTIAPFASVGSAIAPPRSNDPRVGASVGGGPSAKKRKLDAEFEGFGAGEDAMAGLDEDVAELLRAESGGAV
ncbi:MAG: hypothetical protein Q9211_004494, partial [Gyalolechia sp. 1 TL-2023]